MNDTKAGIIKSAEELISEKGLVRATIAQIAKRTQVADSLVYQYFKDKEDLFFEVAYHRLKDTWDQLQDELQGIIDTRSKLGRIVWWGLKYNDNHQDYVRNLMFEYRSNKDFYSSRAYGLIFKHAEFALHILNQGVEEGIFRSDIDMRLAREILYGAMDFEAVDCVITKEISGSSRDWDDLMALILPMIEVKEPPAPPEKREHILSCAEKVFAEHGFGKAKISDIAALAGVAEGSIYDFFENKEDLLLSITESRLRRHTAFLPETFHITTPLRKLRRFIRYHFTLYLQDRNFLRLFVMENLLSQRFYSSAAFEVFRGYMSMLENIIEEGKACGVFRPEVNSRVFRNMFLGAFTHMALRWIIFHDRHFDKMGEIDQLVDLLCDAVAQRN